MTQCRCAQCGFSHNPYAILLPFCARISVSQRIERIKDIKQSLTRIAKFGFVYAEADVACPHIMLLHGEVVLVDLEDLRPRTVCANKWVEDAIKSLN